MTQQEINKRLVLVAAEKRTHANYQRTVDIAKRYTALSTGVGIDALMKPYTRREDAALFAVRCSITQHVTMPVISKLFAIREKAYRSHYRREVTYGTDEEAVNRAAEFEAQIGQYYGGHGVDGFSQLRLLELNATDPNTWVINEWKDFDNRTEFARPYPFEATAEMAIDFEYEQGELQYLTVKMLVPNPADETKPLVKLTCYQKQFTSVLMQTTETTGGQELPTIDKAGEYAIAGRKWVYEEFIHGIDYVQAKRAGYKRDKVTGGQTFVWPIEPAEPYLLKTLKAVSEMDLTAANVAFPVSIRYGDECNAPGCEDGYIGGAACSVCAGSGKKQSPTSVLEEIVVTPMPTGPDTMLDLSRLLVHVSPDVSILQWQEQYCERLEERCLAADLNSETYNRKEIQQTATGKSIDQQNANDVVYKYFRFYAEFWQFLVYSYADIVGRRKGLTAQIVVSKDLKLKTIQELFLDMKEANEAGVGPATRRAIEWDIMRIVTVDAPGEFDEWQVQERFNPVSGHTEDYKLLWSASPLVPIEQRVLYANLGYIFDQLEAATPNFYRMPYEAQKALIDAKVKEIIAGLNLPTAPDIEV